MPPVHDDAVCLGQWDWSETSQTVLLLTRTHGALRGIAKGSRRPKSAYSGGVEIMTRGEAAFIAKQSGLSTLTAWDLVETFAAARQTLATFHGAAYALDLCRRSLSAGDPHPRVFDALVALLRGLGHDGEDPGLALLRFQWTLAIEIGLAPRLDDPPRPGQPVWRFDPLAARFAEAAPREERWPVRAGTVRLLRAVADAVATDQDLAEEGGGQLLEVWDQEACTRANRFLAAYFGRALETELPSARFAFGVGRHNR
ncbi:MAG: DNA repair protein RecO [Planctomycetota bacterium]